MPQQVLWEGMLAEESLGHLVALCVESLHAVNPFVLFLQGGMGAGKTTFTRYLLRHMGLKESTPVTSPTYTILNEYRIETDYFAHMDFYRLNGGLELDELDALHYRNFRGYIVEWPQNASADLLQPTHVLDIAASNDQRLYKLSVCHGI